MPKESLRDKLDENQLDLSLGNLAVVPVKEMAALPKGTHVDLSCNLLTVLPDDFGILNHIIKLDLSKNQLKFLPESFGELQRLQNLDLFSNKITTLPVSFFRLKSLKWLDVRDNPLSEQLQSVAGDCLNETQCRNCAKRVVAYMRNVQADQERKRQKFLQEEREQEALRKAMEEKEKQRKKTEKLAEKEKRRQEYAAKKASESQQKETVKQEITENQHTTKSPVLNGVSVTAKSKESAGLSCCGSLLVSFIGLITIIAGLYYYCDTHQKDAMCLEMKNFITPYIALLKKQYSTYMKP